MPRCSCNPYAWNPALARDMCPLHGLEAQIDGMDMVIYALVNGAGKLPLDPPFSEEEK